MEKDLPLKTAQWEIIKVFEKPISGDDIYFTEVPLAAPKGIDEMAVKSWDVQLENKKAVLAESGIITHVGPYKDGPYNALYAGSELKMWPGQTITLREVKENDEKIELEVSALPFPYIRLLREQKTKDLYAAEGVQLPRPPIAICTFALTTDNQLTLTVRSSRVNVYPKRLYGQGGNPETSDTTVVAHQEHEIADEIMVTAKDYDATDFRFGGIVSDNDQFVDKTDLVGWIPVRLSSHEIQERVSGRKIQDRPGDAAAVIFAPASAEGLRDFLAMRSHPFQFCPPAHAGLVLYGMHTFGREWAVNVVEDMKSLLGESNFLRNLK